jgi:hypothetical protein
MILLWKTRLGIVIPPVQEPLEPEISGMESWKWKLLWSDPLRMSLLEYDLPVLTLSLSKER